MNILEGYRYLHIPGESTRTLVLLHGTGGSEHDLIQHAHSIDSTADIISLRGNVTEDGMARFFRRVAPGVFDREDLARRTEQLADFIRKASQVHGFPLTKVTSVGYSNGANIALSLLATHPEMLTSAILFRPMSAALPDSIPSLAGSALCILAGKRDRMCPTGDAEKIRDALSEKGAAVALHMSDAGHELVDEDVSFARQWVKKQSGA
ncbi:alpha/beta hydrolase [Candidatus Kaiserbacteria bacterium]|nr:alpha/beta hydrolase [Candidatus Kaiserbacteria bacterium]